MVKYPRLRLGTGKKCPVCKHAIQAHNKNGCVRKDCQCEEPRGFRNYNHPDYQ